MKQYGNRTDPTDFSAMAMHAINDALDLYKCERTNIYFLHAFADEVYAPFEKNNETSVMVNSRHSLEEMLYRTRVNEIRLHSKLPFLLMQNLPR